MLLSVPPLVLSLALLLLASRTGWFPVGGLPGRRRPRDTLRYLVLPALALALPIAAALERLQSRSIADALGIPPCSRRARAAFPAGASSGATRFRLSLKPVLAVYGIIIGALISGSFVVEYVMTWPASAG